jgi:hypothetical protein
VIVPGCPLAGLLVVRLPFPVYLYKITPAH